MKQKIETKVFKFYPPRVDETVFLNFNGEYKVLERWTDDLGIWYVKVAVRQSSI